MQWRLNKNHLFLFTDMNHVFILNILIVACFLSGLLCKIARAVWTTMERCDGNCVGAIQVRWSQNLFMSSVRGIRNFSSLKLGWSISMRKCLSCLSKSCYYFSKILLTGLNRFSIKMKPTDLFAGLRKYESNYICMRFAEI